MRKAILMTILMLGVILTPYSSASDGDGDGVNDDVDICPFAAGTANSTAGLGCPDSDGDGIADFEQAVTHNWGQAIRENTDYGSSGSGVSGMAWAQNFSYFYAGGGNGGVQLFDAQGNHVSTLHQMAGDINEIALSPNGTMLAVASDDGGCKILNSTTGSLIVELLNTTTNILSIAWAGDSSKVILSTGDIEVQWFHTSNWTHEMTISNLPSWTSGIDSTPDGRLIFFSTNNNLRGYWTNNGTMYLNLTNHTEYIRSVKVSPDGRYVATGSNDNNVKITDIATKTVVTTIWAGSDVYDIDFSPDGGTMVVARGRSSDMYAYQTDTWSSLGSMDGFGSSNNNRGVYSVEFHEDGDKLAVGWRRGYVSIHMAADAYIRVHGLHYTSLMENPWRSTYPTIDESVRVWEYDRVISTLDVCDSKHYIGSSTNGVSPQYADKAANYSETGLWDCKYTEGQILEIPYGRAAGALMVTSGGNTETCVQTIGGLSMAQVRWIVSGSTKSTLT
ncbi:MAG: WD40 repeat domain-containing protein, partial [Candidatus Poseidoniaceae archaeon]